MYTISFHNGVTVRPGDLLFGDRDGIVVIPKEIEKDIINAALEKVFGENRVRIEIEKGMPARKAYDTFRIM